MIIVSRGVILGIRGLGRRMWMRREGWIGMSFIMFVCTTSPSLDLCACYEMHLKYGIANSSQAGKDDFLSQSPSPFAHPALLQTTHAPLLRSYMRNAHALVTLILTHLNTHLDLPEGTLQRLHDQKIISGDHVRFIKAPPQPEDDLRTAMGQHTDFGSVTILFNRVGGLQVLPPSLSDSSSGSSEWLYVRPLPGHCIVNLGDAMVAFTNGLLRSNLHRVVAPPGEQARCTRYALVYFARPGDEVPLKRIEAGSSVIPPLASGMVEGGLPSKEHIRRMALGKRVGVSDVPKYLPGEMDERREEVLAN